MCVGGVMLGERPVFCVQALDDLNQFNDYPLSHLYGQTLAKDMKIPKTKALSLLLEIEKAGHSRPMVMNAILEVSWGGTNHTKGKSNPFCDGDEGL